MVPEKSAAPGDRPAGPSGIPAASRPQALKQRSLPGGIALPLALAGAVLALGASDASALNLFKRPGSAEKPATPAESTETAEPAEKKGFRFRPAKADQESPEKETDEPASRKHRFGFLKREVRIPSAPAPVATDTESIVRVQIYLDGQHFGPGKIDGTLGEFTQKAALYYNRTHGIEPGDWGPLLYHARRTVPQTHQTYVVRAEDFNHVGSLPYDPPEQAKKKYMSYRSVLELVSERFHTDENYLRRANPGRALNNLRAGDTVIVPNVSPFRIEDVQKHHHFERADPLSARHLIVDTDEKFALILQDQRLVAAFPITPGQERYIPYGNWKIDSMVTTPTFRYDKRMLEEGVRGDDYHMLPPGPNSPVGIFWAGLTKSGIGLHGTNSPETIGRARSAGCIRLANWDAVRLSSLVRPGATVEVR